MLLKLSAGQQVLGSYDFTFNFNIGALLKTLLMIEKFVLDVVHYSLLNFPTNTPKI
jgi:hypothetical protein